MKKWLRMVLIIGCLFGLTPLLRSQAQKHTAVIQTADLQDQAGKVVANLDSHQPQDVQLALNLTLPAGETVMTLAESDEATFQTGQLDDAQLAESLTAEVDQDQRLVLQNEQDQPQQAAVVVPVKLVDPLLVAKLQLTLKVAGQAEIFVLPAVTVKAAENNQEESSATSSSQNNSQSSSTTNSSTSSQSTTSSQTSVSQRSQSSQLRSRSSKAPAASTTSSRSATKADDDDADAATPAKTKTSKARATTPTLPTATLDVHRAQIQIGSWSDSLDIGGTLVTDSNVVGPKKAATGGNTYWDNTYANQYYYSYQQADNAQAYTVVLNDSPAPAATETIVVYYQNVGAYTTSASAENPTEQMGAIVKISNIVYNNSKPAGKDRYIDFSTNFYSGIVYNGIESFDLDITFITEDGTKMLNFPQPTDDNDYNSYFTFGSLNGNETGEHEWAGTRSGLKGMLSAESLVKERDNGWYEGIGKGVWQAGEPYTGDGEWGDFLGSTNYEKGAVSFPLVGTTQLFKLKSESGFTWQSFSSGYLVPLEAPAPQKTVHRTADLGLDHNNLDGVTIDRDDDDMDSFYYTIYQPTYSIPDESIAKPDKIVLTDQLPAGMTLRDFQLYNTDGSQITGDGKLTVSTGGQVTYELADKEIESLTFDGRSFAFQMRVVIDDNFVGTFKNQATVTFDSGENYTWKKETNEVVTHFQRNLTTLKLKKLGDLTWNPTASEPLKDVVFTVAGPNGQKFTVTTDQAGEATLTHLNKQHTYTITETTPAGYIAGPTFDLAFNKTTGRWQITTDTLQVSISDDAQQVITVTNQRQRGDYAFHKVDSTTGGKLAGAEFIIRNQAGQYLTFDADGHLSGVVEHRDQATKLTAADGVFKVTGLPYGNYQLIETQAPDGYTLGKAHDFTISNKASSAPDQIENDPYSLPVTGGQGIFWFIVLGLILTLSSLAIWRTHPRGE